MVVWGADRRNRSDVTQIDVADAFVEGDLAGGTQGMEGRGSNVGELEFGEEPAEVEWRFGKTIGDKPLAHMANHLRVVVDAGDD